LSKLLAADQFLKLARNFAPLEEDAAILEEWNVGR
jgi:hypothetical protein